jgi:hypothetical protein
MDEHTRALLIELSFVNLNSGEFASGVYAYELAVSGYDPLSISLRWNNLLDFLIFFYHQRKINLVLFNEKNPNAIESPKRTHKYRTEKYGNAKSIHPIHINAANSSFSLLPLAAASTVAVCGCACLMG